MTTAKLIHKALEGVWSTDSEDLIERIRDEEFEVVDQDDRNDFPNWCAVKINGLDEEFTIWFEKTGSTWYVSEVS